MEQKFEAYQKENPEELKECLDFVKASVKDGSYFKDGLNWYFFRYVNPFCERTVLLFAGILSCVICYCLYVMIQGAFPLVQRDPIYIYAKDQSLYFPNLIPLKPRAKGPGSEKYDPAIGTIDEAVSKYLISRYISDREAYDFSKSQIEDVNNKFNHVRNTSSEAEYREFQLYMNKDNPNSPILNFGENVVKTVDVQSFKFIKDKPTDFAGKAKDFLNSTIPTKAEVRFVAVTKTTDDLGNVKVDKQNYVAKISFYFGGASKSSDKADESQKPKTLNFVVQSYKLYKVN